MGYFFGFIFFLFAITVIFIILQSKKDKEKSDFISSLPDFDVTNKFISNWTVALDAGRKKIVFCDKDNKTFFYSCTDILASEIQVDGQTINKKSISKTLGRTLVGGVLTGGVGALVGGLTTSSKQKEKIKSINLKVTVKDLVNPIYKINFLNVETEKGSMIYQSYYSMAEQWHGIFSTLIDQKNN